MEMQGLQAARTVEEFMQPDKFVCIADTLILNAFARVPGGYVPKTRDEFTTFMQIRLMRRWRYPQDVALDLARKALELELEAEGIEFGDEDYTWAVWGAYDIADEFAVETDEW